MNNKVDDVLLSLLKAKESITNNSNIDLSNSSYKDVISGLDDIITNYTINNKMSNKEILDCALSIYGRKYNNKFLEKLNNLRPSKIIEKVKNKINEYHKKKETKKRYEEEIVNMVKEKLRIMIEEDRKSKKQTQDTPTHNKEKSVNNTVEKIPIYSKEVADRLIKEKHSKNFIFQNENEYCIYRKTKDSSPEIVKVSNLNQAIICAKDKNVSSNEIMKNFDKYKNNYGNLAELVTDKRQENTVNFILKEKQI